METPSAVGRHRIDRLLGAGGFASVLLGHDPGLEAPVAIRILAEHWTLRTDVRERLPRWTSPPTYRTSSETVVRRRDVPAECLGYAAKVRRHLDDSLSR